MITQIRLALAVLFVATVAACGPAAPSAQTSPTASAAASASAAPTKGGTLRIGYGAEVDNLNAFTSQFLTDIELTMVEGLIVSNDKNEYIPVLAKQVPTVANGLVKTRADGKLELTWPLQQGVMWHDQVWHRGAPNQSKDRVRWVQQAPYGRRFIAQRFYPFINYRMPAAILERANPRRKRLLGLHGIGAYG